MPPVQIQSKIHTIRGVEVMLDSDIASLYQVETKRINEAVKNNPEKFPHDFMFELTEIEFVDLRSKISTANFSMVRTKPKVFTEQGVYMLATILKGDIATEVTISIMRTFTAMRRYLQDYSTLTAQIAELKTQLDQDRAFTHESFQATAEAIRLLEEMVLSIKSAKEVEKIGFV